MWADYLPYEPGQFAITTNYTSISNAFIKGQVYLNLHHKPEKLFHRAV